MSKEMDDREFAELALGHLRSAPAPDSQALEARIIADFNSVRTRPGLRARLSAALRVAFPGIRPWQPALAFAAALMIGGVAGMQIPAQASDNSAAAVSPVQRVATDSYSESGVGTALEIAGEM